MRRFSQDKLETASDFMKDGAASAWSGMYVFSLRLRFFFLETSLRFYFSKSERESCRERRSYIYIYIFLNVLYI